MRRTAVIIILVFSLLGIKNIYAQVGVSVTVVPPALPVYEQPPCPVDGYLWCPGYWAYGSDGYYWVPGVWVAPPEAGLLWTPGYWGFVDGDYIWYGGYWGTTIGFYGGVCYGFGYGGHGFYGGRWEGGRFMYNTAAWHVNNTVIHNTYVDKTVIHNSGSRASFNGHGGVDARPTASEQAAMKERHISATSTQRANEHTASMNKNQFASVNKGRPSTTARSTVGGQRFTPSGHSINTAHSTSSAHTTPSNAHTTPRTTHSTNNAHVAPTHATTHPAHATTHVTHTTTHPTHVAAHHATAKPQAPAHNVTHNRPAPPPQHNVPQNRPAPQAQPNVERAMPRQTAPPPRQAEGGEHPMSGGEEKRH